MKKTLAVCAVLLFALACQAGAVTSYIDTFNGGYVGGPIGSMPSGWTYWGFGVPAYTSQETGLTQPPNDGSNSAYRFNVTGATNFSGTTAIYKSMSVDNYAVAGQPIDWNYPVYIKADIYAVDYGTGTKWNHWMTLTNYSRTEQNIEWGDNGIANGQWTTITTTLNAGQAGKSGSLYLIVDFTQNGSSQNVNASIWENVRIEYTAVPEPSSFAALAAGLVGFGGFVRRRK